MTILDLTGQAQLADQLRPAFGLLRASLLARKPIWDELSPEQRRSWLRSGKDPMLELSRDVYTFLDKVYEAIRDDLAED